jgi:hypothetical protein
MENELVGLNDLAEKINTSHRESLDSAKHAVLKAKETGDYLIQAKELVPHGEWSDFLQKNTTVSNRQSQKCMRLSRNWNEIEAKANSRTHLGINDALELIADSKPSEVDLIADSIRERIGRVKSFLEETVELNEVEILNGKLASGKDISITMKELVKKILAKKIIFGDEEVKKEMAELYRDDKELMESILACGDFKSAEAALKNSAAS